jgi:hypothetical protein
MRRSFAIATTIFGLGLLLAGCAQVDVQAPDARQVPTVVPITLIVVGAVIALGGAFMTKQSKDGTSTNWGMGSVSVPLPGFVLMVGAMLAASGGFLAYIGSVPTTVAGPPATPSPSNSPSPSGIVPGPTTPAPTTALIEEPVDAEGISARGGVVMRGSASGLAEGDTLWVFDYDPGRDWHYWFVNQQPIKVDAADTWEIENKPIGADSDEIGTEYEIVLVVADENCGLKLRTPSPNPEGDLVLKSLPDGCRLVDSVVVVKERR